MNPKIAAFFLLTLFWGGLGGVLSHCKRQPFREAESKNTQDQENICIGQRIEKFEACEPGFLSHFLDEGLFRNTAKLSSEFSGFNMLYLVDDSVLMNQIDPLVHADEKKDQNCFRHELLQAGHLQGRKIEQKIWVESLPFSSLQKTIQFQEDEGFFKNKKAYDFCTLKKNDESESGDVDLDQSLSNALSIFSMPSLQSDGKQRVLVIVTHDQGRSSVVWERALEASEKLRKEGVIIFAYIVQEKDLKKDHKNDLLNETNTYFQNITGNDNQVLMFGRRNHLK